MNVVIGTEAAQFLFCEYLFQIFGIVSLQCVGMGVLYRHRPLHSVETVDMDSLRGFDPVQCTNDTVD